MKAEFLQLIRDGSLNPNNQVREQSENTLLDIRKRDPQNFFHQCCEVFIAESENIAVRATAGTILLISLKEMEVN